MICTLFILQSAFGNQKSPRLGAYVAPRSFPGYLCRSGAPSSFCNGKESNCNGNPSRYLRPFAAICGLILFSTLFSGCSTPGGLVVGPVSGYFASGNENSSTQRALFLAQDLQPKQKQQLLRATNLGVRPGEFAVAAGIDLLAIPETSLTWSEILKNAAGVIIDAGIYTGIGLGVSALTDSGSSEPSYALTFQGDVNNSSFQTGSPSATQQHSREDNSTKGIK